MVLGILSDSHGRADLTRIAVAKLLAAGAQSLIHLGDIGSETVLDELIGHDAHVVFGNCDDDIPSLMRYAEAMGIRVHHPLGMLEVDGKQVAFTHGHLLDELRKALATSPEYLLHGHTHEIRDERQGATRIINPGALSRAARYTAAMLDPAADDLTVLDVGKSILRSP